MTLTLPDDLAAKLEAIARLQNRPPEDVLRDLLDAVESPKPQKRPDRIPGLGQGTIWVSDDFNEPLDDEFWLGES